MDTSRQTGTQTGRQADKERREALHKTQTPTRPNQRREKNMEVYTPTYQCGVELEVFEVGVIEQTGGLYVDGRLLTTLRAQSPVRVHPSPELWT